MLNVCVYPTQFEPLELDCEQKKVWIMFLHHSVVRVCTVEAVDCNVLFSQKQNNTYTPFTCGIVIFVAVLVRCDVIEAGMCEKLLD